MNDSNIMSAEDMVTKMMNYIDPSKVRQASKVILVWRQIVSSIKSNSINGENIGANMASHSNVVDLKNGVLLVEADHPGWIQMLKTYQNYILKGFRLKLPQVKVNSLVFRLKGSNEEFLKERDKIEFEKERENLRKKFEENEKELEKQGFSYKPKNSEEKNSLPPEIQKIFDDLKNDILTNNK